MEINKKIKKLRKEKGLTQKDFANIINISEMSIRRYESGDRKPSVETLNKIAAALNVSVNDLISDSNTIDLSSMSNEDLDFIYGNNDLIALKDIFSKLGYKLKQNGPTINILKGDGIIASIPENDFIDFGRNIIKPINEFCEFQINKLIDTYEFLGD